MEDSVSDPNLKFDCNQTTSTMVLFDFVEDNQQRIRHILLIILLIHHHHNIWDRHCLWLAIVHPSESPWRRLYDRADEASFLHMTGLNRRAFVMLMDHMFDLEALACRCRGHPCLLGPEGYLGLLLFYLGSTMNYIHLCHIFGIAPLVCSCGINGMLKKMCSLWGIIHLWGSNSLTERRWGSTPLWWRWENLLLTIS